MTVELRAVCDACGCGGPTLDAEAASTEQARTDARLVDGSGFGLRDVHEACLADLERGVDPATAYGFGGLCSVDDLEPT